VTDHDELAQLLRHARLTGTPVPRATAPDIDAASGHAVQAAGRALAMAAGERVVGRKVGLTSAAAQQTMDTDGPVSGYLLGTTVARAAAEFDGSGLGAPRVEVEVAFVLAAPLEGSQVSAADVRAATEYVAPALEIVDSRWAGGPPGVGALLADNVSAAAVVLGEAVDPGADLTDVRATVQLGDRTAAGDAGAVLGDPALAVAWLVADLHRRGERLEAGDLVISGALIGPVPVQPGERVHADLGRLGSIETVFGG
jgi:2-keto-4-pentenoate hydratase